MKKVVVLLGVTASGKSKIAINLAERLNGEVISSDSVQVYRRLNIGSAKPSFSILNRIRHHLIDILNPDQTYSAASFVTRTQQAIEAIYQRKKIPIIIGGNMLYIRSLIYGIAKIPTINQESKQKAAQFYKSGLGFCYQKLLHLDPLSAKNLKPQDKQRILRALEVVLATGKSIFMFQAEHGFCKKNYQPLYLEINISKERVNNAINTRVLKMLQAGFLDEVTELLKDYNQNLASLQTIGYKQAIAFLNGNLSRQQMIIEIQQKSRQYAKRQRTWYQRLNSVTKIEPAQFELEKTLNFIQDFLTYK